jgi:hypothetical protein
VKLVGVSHDDVIASGEFADKYGIAFPLLADTEGVMSQAYVGNDGADNTIPGIVLVKQGGAIVYRQIATAKDDRLTAAQLLAVVDEKLGTSGAGIDAHYAVLRRWQLRFAVGGGAGRRDVVNDAPIEWAGARVASLGLMFPVHRYVLAGVRGEYGNLELASHAVAGLRIPLLHDTAAIELTGSFGYGSGGDSIEASWLAGGRIGAWVAWTPTWAFTVDAGVELRVGIPAESRRSHDTLPIVTGMVGVARLLEF